MTDPIPRIDWNSADKAAVELRARLQREPPSMAGVGLGQNGDVLDNLGGDSGNSDRPTLAYLDDILVTLNGTVYITNIATSGRLDEA